MLKIAAFNFFDPSSVTARAAIRLLWQLKMRGILIDKHKFWPLSPMK